MNSSDSVTRVYQIYYKTKGFVPKTTQHLINYGKSIQIRIKWSEANRFMKNSKHYLDSLIADDVLDNISLPQREGKKPSISIKVQNGVDYYWVKDLTINSKIDDICNKLAPRLQLSCTKINLYRCNGFCKGYDMLSRSHTLSQLNVKGGDSLSLGIYDISTGTDFIESIIELKKEQEPEPVDMNDITKIKEVNDADIIRDAVNGEQNQKQEIADAVMDKTSMHRVNDMIKGPMQCISLINDIILIFETKI